MMKKFKKAIAGLAIVPVLAFVVSFATPLISQPVGVAADCSTSSSEICQGVTAAKGDSSTTCLFTNSSCTNGIFTTIVNILLFLIGAVSVIMLIIGGIRYTLSGGASAEVTNAKNTILYAIIGIVVAFLAYAIVNWVLGSLTSS